MTSGDPNHPIDATSRSLSSRPGVSGFAHDLELEIIANVGLAADDVGGAERAVLRILIVATGVDGVAIDGDEDVSFLEACLFSRGPFHDGADEDAQGAPFVGRAGKLLDRMIAAAGLEGRVFITNTVFWRPPGNRTPSPDEQLACAPFLERAIALVKPKVLLLAGGASAKSVLKQTTGILALRGRWFEWTSEDGSLEIPAMPTLHPAFLLRTPSFKRETWRDLNILKQRLDLLQ